MMCVINNIIIRKENIGWLCWSKGGYWEDGKRVTLTLNRLMATVTFFLYFNSNIHLLINVL